jgi:hypothetical protein
MVRISQKFLHVQFCCFFVSFCGGEYKRYGTDLLRVGTESRDRRDAAGFTFSKCFSCLNKKIYKFLAVSAIASVFMPFLQP